ncbi:MAG: hypothetical protein UY48_C0003G0003 [Candidatus Gottesmanbacteria bacterium GW2011_GWB1_49_7]|uniref:Uncharacterized protein n=1 Tax=Candidatus Gottesmanbacteria bacterium GW2011_GWB1_49_7 TaxID=1618448 RepID=A0A0G1W359_9BACT|nr:MAG: hypothetical protein UY48_C0003G0003 [Candidatus Gottesmanbacteria bacterium GW2011_GWB1_49_7]
MGEAFKNATKQCTAELDELISDLGARAKDLVPREAEDALRSAAQMLLVRATELAPKKTGLLASTGRVSDIMRNVVIDGVPYSAAIEVRFGGPELLQAKGVDYSPIVEEGYDTKLIIGNPRMHWKWEPGQRLPKYGWVDAAGWAHTRKVERWASPNPFLNQATEELAGVLQGMENEILRQVVIHFTKGKR